MWEDCFNGTGAKSWGYEGKGLQTWSAEIDQEVLPSVMARSLIAEQQWKHTHSPSHMSCPVGLSVPQILSPLLSHTALDTKDTIMSRGGTGFLPSHGLQSDEEIKSQSE